MKSVAALSLTLGLAAWQQVGLRAQAVLRENGQDQRAAKPDAADRIATLNLPAPDTSRLRTLLQDRDYPGAQALLLHAIALDPHSIRTAHLLDFVAGVYLLAHDDLGAAIALSKADAREPLEPTLRFALAMSLVRLNRRSDARKQLEQLAAQAPSNALYPYWLGRLDYDAQDYAEAQVQFHKAIALDPDMARAYDSLGLCLFYLNRNDDAVAEYRKAIALGNSSSHPSPWPYLDLGMALEFTGDLSGAATNLRESIRLDPTLTHAHLELGNVLERQAQQPAAIAEFERAAKLDPTYPEPHVALARLYRRLGQNARSEQEVATYRRLKDAQANVRNGKPATAR